MKMPEDERQYWRDQKAKMPSKEELQELKDGQTMKMKMKMMGAGEVDIEALRKENDALKEENRALKMGTASREGGQPAQ